MVENATKAKRINVSGTVTPELNEFIENHRWTNRMSKSDVINAALATWAESVGFEQPGANGVVSEGDTSPEGVSGEAESGTLEAADDADADDTAKATPSRASRRR